MKDSVSQKAIKIDANLWQELERWLGTNQAQKLGYHSKAQFATEAVRDLLNYSKGVGKTKVNATTKKLETKVENMTLNILKQMEKRLQKIENK